MPVSKGLLALVKDRDANAPTVTEWRASVAALTPAITTFMAANPKVEQAKTDVSRVASYQTALKVKADPLASGLVKIEAQAVIDLYEAKPVAATALTEAKALFVERDGQPSVVQTYDYYKGVQADALKADAVKALELQAKDRMCYKRGDVVEVFPPGTEYVVPCAEPFYCLEILDVPLKFEEVVAQFQQSEVDAATQQPVRRRAFGLNLDALPEERPQGVGRTAVHDADVEHRRRPW